MNSLSSLDETCGEYSVAHTKDQQFWRSEVKSQGYSRPLEVAKAFTSMLGCWSPSGYFCLVL